MLMMGEEKMSQLYSSPLVQPALAQEIAPGVIVLPDPHIDLVPNIGIIVGTQAALVVDCGMGKENGSRVLDKARELAEGKPLLLTTTHYHPEHAFGAQVFKGQATIIANTTQADELREKGPSSLNVFRQIIPAARDLLAGVKFVEPDETYQGERVIDLGGKQVLLRELPAHTRGDQIIFLPQERILFTGDLVENHLFPIFPDQDAHDKQWIAAVEQMLSLSPATVVPGHGDLGSTELLEEFREHLTFVREEVERRIKEGQELDLVDREVIPIVKGRYQEWGNDMFIAFEIHNIYAELTGTPLRLPTF